MAAEGSLDLPPAAFLPEVGSAGVLWSGHGLVNDATPGLTVSSKCRPWVLINVTGTEGLLGGAFKTFLWCSSVTVASGEFILQVYLWKVIGPLFWTHALLIVDVTSATWPLRWWFLPDQVPHHWRRSGSSKMFRMVWRQRWWKCSRSCSWWRQVTHDSGPYSRAVNATAR